MLLHMSLELLENRVGVEPLVGLDEALVLLEVTLGQNLLWPELPVLLHMSVELLENRFGVEPLVPFLEALVLVQLTLNQKLL